jgi:hypothetical protein
MNPLEHIISVRELAEFVHRRGDLESQSNFRRSNRALEGMKGHKRIQQSRGSDYRPEITVKRSFVREEVGLRVIGRVDGVVDGLTPLMEEFDSVRTRSRGGPAGRSPLPRTQIQKALSKLVEGSFRMRSAMIGSTDYRACEGCHGV